MYAGLLEVEFYLLVPWRLLQRLFYCFSATWLAKVESSQKSNGIWFLRHFSRHICSTVAETIRVTNYTASFGAKNVQKTTFEAAEMMLSPWNQQYHILWIFIDWWNESQAFSRPCLLKMEKQAGLISYSELHLLLLHTRLLSLLLLLFGGFFKWSCWLDVW